MAPAHPDPGAGGVADGRALRGERTRTAIVDALLALIEEGEPRPTSRQIAARAEVSVRSIFQHFADLEALYADLVRVQSARVQPLVDDLDGSGTTRDRAVELARQRAELFEAIAPIRRSVGTRARHSPAVTGRLRDLSSQLHRQVRRQFAAELGTGDSSPDGAPAVTGTPGETRALAIDLLCSFDAWEHLRDHHGLGVEEARQVLVTGMLGVLGGD